MWERIESEIVKCSNLIVFFTKINLLETYFVRTVFHSNHNYLKHYSETILIIDGVKLVFKSRHLDAGIKLTKHTQLNV